MGDMAEDFKALRQVKGQRKAQRYAATVDMLQQRGIGYQQGKNSNIIVAGRYELWPSTHAWLDRRTGRRGRGIDGFLKMVETGGEA